MVVQLPSELDEVFEESITVSYVSISKAGQPITVPLTPYRGASGTLDVTTGLTYPAKAERARHNPKVCLLFSDPIGAGMERAPVVMVQGSAAVRDSDLQANTDRYIEASLQKLPATMKGQPRFLLRRFAWYFARIWIEVTPRRVLWWPERALDSTPKEWSPDAQTEFPDSDPAPRGAAPPPWLEAPVSWRQNAEGALQQLSQRDLAFVGTDGFPLCVPALDVSREDAGFSIQLPAGVDPPAAGPACLNLHHHNEVFTGQENRSFLGRVEHRGDNEVFLSVERSLADWSLPGGRVRIAAGFLAKGRRLKPRLAREAERRGQTVPAVRFPGEY